MAVPGNTAVASWTQGYPALRFAGFISGQGYGLGGDKQYLVGEVDR